MPTIKNIQEFSALLIECANKFQEFEPENCEQSDQLREIKIGTRDSLGIFSRNINPESTELKIDALIAPLSSGEKEEAKRFQQAAIEANLDQEKLIAAVEALMRKGELNRFARFVAERLIPGCDMQVNLKKSDGIYFSDSLIESFKDDTQFPCSSNTRLEDVALRYFLKLTSFGVIDGKISTISSANKAGVFNLDEINLKNKEFENIYDITVGIKECKVTAVNKITLVKSLLANAKAELNEQKQPLPTLHIAGAVIAGVAGVALITAAVASLVFSGGISAPAAWMALCAGKTALAYATNSMILAGGLMLTAASIFSMRRSFASHPIDPAAAFKV